MVRAPLTVCSQCVSDMDSISPWVSPSDKKIHTSKQGGGKGRRAVYSRYAKGSENDVTTTSTLNYRSPLISYHKIFLFFLCRTESKLIMRDETENAPTYFLRVKGAEPNEHRNPLTIQTNRLQSGT